MGVPGKFGIFFVKPWKCGVTFGLGLALGFLGSFLEYFGKDKAPDNLEEGGPDNLKTRFAKQQKVPDNFTKSPG